MAISPNTPVIIGVAQKTIRRDALPGPEPLQAWDDCCRLAAEDAGIAPETLRETGFLALADCLSWPYDDPIARLADRLGAQPSGSYYSQPSGTAGLSMFNEAAAAIHAGKADIAVLCGGESLATRKLYARDKQTPPWSFPAPPERPSSVNLEARQHPGEVAIGLFDGMGAVYTFAMRDIARRAHLGVAPDAYRRQLGELLAGMTRVASRNPDAWFPESHDAGFLADPRPDNRMIAYPYTKHMVAIIDVDITAALIVTSEAKADALGIPREKRIYPWASAYAEDPVDTAVRPDLWKSEGMEAASQAVLKAAGITIDQVPHIDLYSCFSAAVNFACDALGIQPDGERITVTGGLPYAGGPASSYVLTSLAKMVGRLRADREAFGLVSGVGMMMSNHAFGLFSNRAPSPDIVPVDNKALQAEVNKVPLLPITDRYAGPATVATYTIMYDRNGDATHGAAICDLPDGSRAYARILDKQLLAEAETEELVGRKLALVAGDGAGELRYG